MLSGIDIVCIAPVDWEPIWNRSQQLMSRFPDTNRILYLEPPATLLSAIKDRGLWFKWGRWLAGPRPVKKNIRLYSPPVVLPFGNVFPLINRINQRWLLFFTRRIMRRLGFAGPLVWTYLPNSLELARGLDPLAIVYDCVDEHSEFSGLINKEVVLSMERELLAHSDLVFTTAEGLFKGKKPYAKNIYLLPNAADVDHFFLTDREETPVPGDIAGLPGPVLGFIGVIHDWIDLDLIEHVAVARPGWSVAMIGPLGPGVNADRLKELPNVYFFGRRDKGELPGYLKAFDVCLNAFRLNELTDRVNPLKIYEYLASGRPVVSVDMPGVREFGDVIEIAGDYDGFVRAVERALERESGELKKRRLEVAARHSWQVRVEFILQKINEMLNKNPESRIQNPE